MKFRVGTGFLEITAETPEEGVAIGSAWNRLFDSGAVCSIANGTTLHVKVVLQGKPAKGEGQP